jgi:hypothetical protein
MPDPLAPVVAALPPWPADPVAPPVPPSATSNLGEQAESAAIPSAIRVAPRSQRGERILIIVYTCKLNDCARDSWRGVGEPMGSRMAGGYTLDATHAVRIGDYNARCFWK